GPASVARSSPVTAHSPSAAPGTSLAKSCVHTHGPGTRYRPSTSYTTAVSTQPSPSPPSASPSRRRNKPRPPSARHASGPGPTCSIVGKASCGKKPAQNWSMPACSSSWSSVSRKSNAALPDDVAAVDHDLLAGDVGTLVACEVEDRLRD